MSTKGKAVKGISQEQRYYLCLKKVECPDMKQSELADWFKQKYGRAISQPTISHTLKKKTEVLERGLNRPGMNSARLRNRDVKHPEFERTLYQWYISLSDAEAMALTGPMLIDKAKALSREMQLRDPQVYCNGWLSRFRTRYGIQHGRRRDERGGNIAGGGNIRQLLNNGANNSTPPPSSPKLVSTPPSSSVPPLIVDGDQHTVSSVICTATEGSVLPLPRMLQQDSDGAGLRVKRQKTTQHSVHQSAPPPSEDTISSLTTVPSSPSASSIEPATKSQALTVAHHTYHFSISAVAAAAASKEASGSFPRAPADSEQPSQLQYENQLHMELLRSLPFDSTPATPSVEQGESAGREGDSAVGPTVTADSVSSTATPTSPSSPTATTTTTTWPHTATFDDESILARIAARTRSHYPVLATNVSAASTVAAAASPSENRDSTVVSAASLDEAAAAAAAAAATATAAAAGETAVCSNDPVPQTTPPKTEKCTADDVRTWLNSIRAYVYQQHEASSSLPALPEGGRRSDSEEGVENTPPLPINSDKAYKLLAELQEVLDV